MPGRVHHGLGHRSREGGAPGRVEHGGEPRLAECERPQRDDDPRVVLGSTGHSLRMLPSVDAVYPAAKAVFWPWLRYGLRWTIEGESHIPTRRVRRSSRATTSRISTRSRSPGWPTAAGVGCGSSPRPSSSRKPGLGTLLRAAHQIPVHRGTADSSGALSAAVAALRHGECVAVFPEGTISEDLEPMRGKSGTARLALDSGVPVVPIGLWGTHRMMMKGRKPHWAWGVAQVAVVGEPVVVTDGEHVKDATLRIMDAVTECVARARAIYPQRPAPGDDAWWWRDPDTAAAHRRPA